MHLKLLRKEPLTRPSAAYALYDATRRFRSVSGSPPSTSHRPRFYDDDEGDDLLLLPPSSYWYDDDMAPPPAPALHE
jgi:hypothetical protein